MIQTNGPGKTSLVVLDVQLAADEFLHGLANGRLLVPPDCEAQAAQVQAGLELVMPELRALQLGLAPHIERVYGVGKPAQAA